MKYRLLELLHCPKCERSLTLHVFKEIDCDTGEAGYDKEIVDGLFTCPCGACYPVINEIPVFVNDNLTNFPEFHRAYEGPINLLTGRIDKGVAYDDYQDIRQSFSEEWGIFEYEKDNTWGWSLEERKKIFLDDMNLKEGDVKGKLLLDAGCGNGSLTSALNGLGMEVVGFDIHNGLPRAQREKGKFTSNNPHTIHFVQGNLFQPPFKKKVFDYIYSSGVIHHTPDSENTFSRICPLVKDSGRVYVWVYGQRPWSVRAFQWTGRQLRKVLPLKALYYMCRGIAPFYKVTSEALNALKIMPFRKRTTREITLDLFDAFSPQFNHRHKESEVMEWFQIRNFTNIHVSGIQKHGFGVYGDMKS